MEAASQFRADLLRLPLVRRLLALSSVPVVFQAVTLLAMFFLVINGWALGFAETPERLLTLRKTNLTTLLVWGLWWPGMIALAIFAGRAWCTVCPMELASRLGRLAGRRVGLARIPLTSWLRAGWLRLANFQ